MPEPRGEGSRGPVLFRPDHDLVHRLLEAVYHRRAQVNLKLELTDLHSGQIQTVFVRWDEMDLEALAGRVEAALNHDADPMVDQYERYFWLFWRGWSGCLNGDMLLGLPAVTPDLLNKVRQGMPLRDIDLRKLQSALEWAFANSAAEWGDTESWADDTISPGHLSFRKKVGHFIRQRMTDLHGPDYENAPVG